MIAGWSPHVGDPTAIGWITTLAYLAGAAAAARAAWRGDGIRRPPVPFWVGVAVLMALLGINKQLDLQTAFTQIMRHFARAQGWYGQRRTLQAVFILMMSAAGCAVLLAVWRHARVLQRSKAIAIVGLFLVYTYATLRAASFYHVDVAAWHNKLGFHLGWTLEVGGICAVIYGAFAESVARQRRLTDGQRGSAPHRGVRRR